MSSNPASNTADRTPQVVEFFWRPGCPFCMLLERSLDQEGVTLAKRNIWEEPEAAAIVRSIAEGNETVPTVRIGTVAMVNPSAKQVLAALAATTS
jgi:mycoredoxin